MRFREFDARVVSAIHGASFSIERSMSNVIYIMRGHGPERTHLFVAYLIPLTE